MARATCPLHTYSIVARDPKTTELGVAVQSHWFSVGSLVPWADAGVGAVATQSFVEVSYGPQGLELMRKGVHAPEALRELVSRDGRRDWRQVAMVDSEGIAAAHTGPKCIPFASHTVGDGWSVQANMMLGTDVVSAMATSMIEAKGDLAERLLHALEVAQDAGGDIRGEQSAAILIVGGKPNERPWERRVLELRVEDHHAPVTELRRLLILKRAYGDMSVRIEALLKGDLESATRNSDRPIGLRDSNPELRFWDAITLVRNGELKKAIPRMRSVFATDQRWRELVSRLPAADLLSRREVSELLELIGATHGA